jgi:hypothetical protein
MWGEGGRCGAPANEYSCARGAQINFGDLTPYLTYGFNNYYSLFGCRVEAWRLLFGLFPRLLEKKDLSFYKDG